MLTIFVVLVHLALLAATGSRPRRSNVGKFMRFTKRNNLTDEFQYPNTQLSDLSIMRRNNAMHTEHSHSLAPPQKVSVPLEKHVNKLVWSTDILVEDAAFKVVVDTGATDLWVFLPGTKVPKFAQEQNSERSQETFAISYLDDSHIEGIVHSGTVTLGSIRVDDQYFGGATSLPSQFEWEGVLGLPPVRNHKSIHHLSFLHEAIKQRKISPKFAINPAVPQLDLGDIDHEAYTGSIEYHKVLADELDWALENCYIAIHRAGRQGTEHIVHFHIHRTHIDSGAGVIFGDPGVVKELYRRELEASVGGKGKAGNYNSTLAPSIRVRQTASEEFKRHGIVTGQLVAYFWGSCILCSTWKKWKLGLQNFAFTRRHIAKRNVVQSNYLLPNGIFPLMRSPSSPDYTVRCQFGNG